jgi:DNA-binding FadR family transcriptional regulator
MCLPIQPEGLYKQTVSQVEQRILAGELKASDQLPSEHELAKQYAVRWTAVREPIKALRENVW